jgi:hypothetical protein
MIDARITSDGDIDIEAGRGDIALTGYSSTPSVKDDATAIAQMARMALSTERGDFLLHQALGNELRKIVGYPNRQDTAAFGKKLIKSALLGWGIANNVEIESWPKDLNTLAFEVKIAVGPSNKELSFVLEQGLQAFE